MNFEKKKLMNIFNDFLKFSIKKFFQEHFLFIEMFNNIIKYSKNVMDFNKNLFLFRFKNLQKLR